MQHSLTILLFGPDSSICILTKKIVGPQHNSSSDNIFFGRSVTKWSKWNGFAPLTDGWFFRILWTNWLNRTLSICTQFICLMVDSGFALSNIVLRKKSRAYYRTFMHTWNALNVDCNFASDWFKERHEFPWIMTRHYRAKTINQRLTIYKKIMFAGQKR